ILETLVPSLSGPPEPLAGRAAADLPAAAPDDGEPPPEGLAGAVLAALPPGALRLPEEIAAALEVPVDQVLGALLDLELAGRARRHPGSAYGRT
ncbi:MAG TPA: hypothetical protein DD490_07365, partial [Acidobacteria bacterium]|nr:hypothetical protein [Acidobacteriota bacterium]